MHLLKKSVDKLTYKLDLLSSKPLTSLEVLLAILILIGLAAPVQWGPLGLVLEQAHSLCVLQAIVSTSSSAICML